MLTNRINPMPIIQAWLLRFHWLSNRNMTRSELVSWIASAGFNENPQLAADCLIAAGIGREPEQVQTVYVSASCDDPTYNQGEEQCQKLTNQSQSV